MRLVFPLMIGVAALGACTHQSDRVSATPPTVSYRITGSDISQANLSANQYCQRYGASGQYQGLQQAPSGTVAVYTCTGPAVSSGSSIAPSPYAAAPAPYAPSAVPGEACADMLHQGRPGGSDYHGPPVAGCTPTQ